MEEKEANAFLPAFYANLESVDIPSAARMKTAFPAGENNSISRAWTSLQSIYSLPEVPVDAFAELWPSLWKWVRFFHTYRDYFAWMIPGSLPEEEMCTDLLQFVGGFHESESAIKIALDTPGFQYMITRAWFFRLRDDTSDFDLGYPEITHLLLRNMDARRLHTVQELIDGAGGTLIDLASLVVGYIHGFLPARTDSVPFEVLYLLYDIVDFIIIVDAASDGLIPSFTMDESLGSFSAALLSQGIVKALTTMTYALSHATDTTGALTLLGKTLAFILRIFEDARGCKFIGEALDAGLVYTIAFCAVVGVSQHESNFILARFLPAMVYYHNVRSLDNAFAEAQELLHTEAFHSSGIVDEWRRFTALARERVELCDSFRARQVVRRRACDNVEVRLVIHTC